MSQILTSPTALRRTPERFGLIATLAAPVSRTDRRELQHWVAAHLARARRCGAPSPRLILFGSRGERTASREVLLELGLAADLPADLQIATATEALRAALTDFDASDATISVNRG